MGTGPGLTWPSGAVEALSLDEVIEHSTRSGAAFVELPLEWLERALVMPAPTVPFERPSGRGAAHESCIHTSRQSKPMDGAAEIGRRWRAAGVPIRFLASGGAGPITAEEADFACRLAAAVGAEAVVVFPASVTEAVRTTRGHYAVPLAIRASALVPVDLGMVLSRAPALAASIDLVAWLDSRHGSPMPWIARHATRVAQLRLDACGSEVAPFSDHTAAVVRCLDALQASRLDIPVVVEAGRWPPEPALALRAAVRAIVSRSDLTLARAVGRSHPRRSGSDRAARRR